MLKTLRNGPFGNSTGFSMLFESTGNRAAVLCFLAFGVASYNVAARSFCMKALGPHLAARTAMVHTSINLEIKNHSTMLLCRSEDFKVLTASARKLESEDYVYFQAPTHQP